MESRNARLQRVVVDTRRGQVAVAVELVLIRRHRPVRQVRSAPQHGHAAGQTASLSAPRNLLVQALHQACVACQVGFLPTAGSDATARGSSGGSGAGSDSALYQCAPVETTTMMSWNSLDSNG